jgi:hypothetical protein
MAYLQSSLALLGDLAVDSIRDPSSFLWLQRLVWEAVEVVNTREVLCSKLLTLLALY